MHPFPDLPLLTPRLRLRPFEPGDAPALFALLSDPRVMRYWGSGAWTELAQAEQSIAADARHRESGAAVRLALQRLNDGAVIGQCTLFAFMRPSRRAEVGYALAPDAQGQGLMHEALQALLRYGFEVLDLNRVEADIDPRNTPSARTLERLGFVREGYLKARWIVGGEVSDTALYGLLRPAAGAPAAVPPGLHRVGPHLADPAGCEAVLRSLPEWFGIEDALQQYARDSQRLPGFAWLDAAGQVQAFVSLAQHAERSWELHCMAVAASRRGQGLGRALLQQAEAWLRGQGAHWLQVKTVADSHPSPGYALTRGFWQAMGFEPLEVFPTLWAPHIPALQLIKRLGWLPSAVADPAQPGGSSAA